MLLGRYHVIHGYEDLTWDVGEGLNDKVSR